MANPDHLAMLMEGVEQWNRARQEAYPKTLHPSNDPAANAAIAKNWDWDLYKWDLTGADLSGKDLRGFNLADTDLAGANLRGADLRKTWFLQADLSGADLRGADLEGTLLMRANLSNADLRGAKLDKVGLSNANLRAVKLANSRFMAGDFREANLSEADLLWTSFSGSFFNKADLRGATLWGTSFTGCVLGDADLTGALLGRTVFADVDLSSVKGLSEVNHEAPSEISIGTIYRSAGKIPNFFLRGAGVPDNFITYVGSFVVKPIEYNSCFISYSHQDEEFAQKLYSDLQAKGVRCFYAPEDMAGGKKLHEQIDEAILLHDRLLLILSTASMASKWVKTEIAKARKREEKEKRRVLFPVRLVSFEDIQHWECFDADTGIDSAKEIREYFIPDFSNWKDHDQYKKAFERLLKDLKAETEKAAAQS